ncbi:uncharacterized mitochondrial protein AtMg00810-like [Vicia villosa]|uniref:uncharacterized mitochondrial protein AtMg00810-like n=1 Tax=Vicia villosa TaxID=3911 RepID=UPI00273AF172|nr:uncharacterized mitochondrial protein AtMg00810-like [Vicia villosa]
MAAQNSWPIFQLDVKSTFLHGDLREEEGFQKCPYKHTLFTKTEDEGKMLIVCLYVDDLIYTGNNTAMFGCFKKSMMAEFEMFDLGVMHYFLGIEVVQSSTRIFISQKKYVRDIMNKFQMKDCNPVNTPSEFGMKLNKDDGRKKVDDTIYNQIVGSLMYLTATRPDKKHDVSVIRRYMECPTEIHLLAAKRIFSYLQGTKDNGLFYRTLQKQSMANNGKIVLHIE